MTKLNGLLLSFSESITSYPTLIPAKHYVTDYGEIKVQNLW